MKTLIATTFFLLVSLWQAVDAHDGPHHGIPRCDSDRLCKNRSPGYYAYRYNTRLFFYCNTLYRNIGCQSCPGKLFYSRKCTECLKREDVKKGKCSGGRNSKPGPRQFCAPKGFCDHKPTSSRLFPNPWDDTQFFSCVNYKPTQCLDCPKPLVLSENCQTCVQRKNKNSKNCVPPNTQPPNNPGCSSNALCWSLPAGWYTYSKNNRYFYYCNAWFQNLGCQKCQKHLVYSRKCGRCLYPADAKAGRCQTPPNQGGNIEFCNPANFCDHRSGVRLYRDANDDTRYFQCVNKKPTPCRSCAPGTVFNMVCQACMTFKTDKASECTGGKSDDEISRIPRCPDNVCAWRPAGDYELAPNSETYASCNAAKQCIKRWCPGSLVYSKACESCQRTYISDPKHCPKNKPPPPPPKTTSTTAPPAATEHPFCNSHFCKKWGALPRAPPAEAYEPDGTFYNCAGAPAFTCYIQKCPAGLIFSESSGACIYLQKPKKW